MFGQELPPAVAMLLCQLLRLGDRWVRGGLFPLLHLHRQPVPAVRGRH